MEHTVNPEQELSVVERKRLAEARQLEEDLLEIFEVQDIADEVMVLKNDDGNVTRSGTVRQAVVECTHFLELEPHVVRQIIHASLNAG